MNELLTIVEHTDIIVDKKRDISKNKISEDDRNLLFDVKFKDKKGKSKYVFSHNGHNKIRASSIVGSISLKNGLIIEILPKFAKNDLVEYSKKRYRKTLINMIRVSNEKNFITSNSNSSKVNMEELPLINYIIELFSINLLNTLRQGLYTSYANETKNSSYIKGNILVSKTMQNNFIDKSKVYTSNNKHTSNNLLMQVFRTLIKILLEDQNLSYSTKKNLYEAYLLLDGVEIINLKSEDFQRITFNRLNEKYEVLFQQARFIYNKYMPFSSKINATPFWSILFDMDYLFEKFVSYLFEKSNINFVEQSVTNCFSDTNKMVSMRPDFIIKNNINTSDKKTICVVDAKWKLLRIEKSLYGLNAQNFWQMFSYMNLVNEKEQINGYFIVPKNSNKFEDEINFKPIIEGNKSIKILSIDFSLEFHEILNIYKYKIQDNQFEIDYQAFDIYKPKRIFAKSMNFENIKQFGFIGFITNKDIIYLKNIGSEFEYFSKENYLLEYTYKNSIYKESLKNSIKNFLYLNNQKTLYFSSFDMKDELLCNIKELANLEYKEKINISSTSYNTKIHLELRANPFFYFGMDFYESNKKQYKDLFYKNKTTFDNLINDFYTEKDKKKTYNAIDEYKEKLKQEDRENKEILNKEITKHTSNKISISPYIPLTKPEVDSCYLENEDDILKLANNKDIRDELKIILFYRKYTNQQFKDEVQNIIKTNSSDNLNFIFATSVKSLVDFINFNYSKISEKYLYGFIYCDNNEHIHAIKSTIARYTKTKDIISILSNEKDEGKILYSILDNYNNKDNEYIVSSEIIEKICNFSIEKNNIKMALAILEREEVTLKIVKKIFSYFKITNLIDTVKKIKYNDESIISWINEIDGVNLNNYFNLSIDDKIDFVIEANFKYYDNDLIKKLCYEKDLDILAEILADKHDTLPLRFVLLIYLNNFKNNDFKVECLFPMIKDKNNSDLIDIVDLHENNDITLLLTSVNDFDREILLGYAMNDNKEFYCIRENICKSTEDLDILDELSKNKDDEGILFSIVRKSNTTFIDKIRSNRTIYSNKTLDRISKYSEYYIFNDENCLIAKVASNFNLNVQTRFELFNTYKDDITILKALNNDSINYNKELMHKFKPLLEDTIQIIENKNTIEQIL